MPKFSLFKLNKHKEDKFLGKNSRKPNPLMPPPKNQLKDESHIDPVFQILQQSSAIRIVSDTSTGACYRYNHNSNRGGFGSNNDGNGDSRDGNGDNSPKQTRHILKPAVRFLEGGANPQAIKYLKNNETPYIVLHSFSPRQKNDMLLRAGQVITVENSKDDNWWYGRDEKDNKGYFPAKFIMKISATDQIFMVEKGHQGLAKSEMSIKKGQIIVCSHTQPASRPGYMYGKSGDREGFIPENCLEALYQNLEE